MSSRVKPLVRLQDITKQFPGVLAVDNIDLDIYQGKVAFIPFLARTATNDQRAAGFKKGLAKYPDLKLVAEQYSQSDYNTALSVNRGYFEREP
jgi:hypothetical protein